MDFPEIARNRKSIRGFIKKNVSRNLILEILTDAHWAPSASNQQPWHFYVLTGFRLEELCQKIYQARMKNKKSYDPSKGKTIPRQYVDRTKNLFKEIRPFINKLGDENRMFIESGSFRFYDAPVVIFITMDTALPRNRFLDIGMAAQNLMLSAYARGLGSCAIALTLLYEEVINQYLDLSDRQETVLSISLGYPDNHFPVNQFRSSRENVSDFITWMGFVE